MRSEIRDSILRLLRYHSLEEIRRGLALFPDDFPESAPAIRAYLLGDLATWPPAFQRAVHEDLEHQCRNLDSARAELVSFEQARAAGLMGRESSCACGCNGRNSRLGRIFTLIREAARDVREAKTPRIRANRRRVLAAQKADLLAALWRSGDRRIDRKALATHAVEVAKREIEELEQGRQHVHDPKPRNRARILELGRLIAQDVPTLVRRYVGCERPGSAA